MSKHIFIFFFLTISISATAQLELRQLELAPGKWYIVWTDDDGIQHYHLLTTILVDSLNIDTSHTNELNYWELAVNGGDSVVIGDDPYENVNFIESGDIEITRVGNTVTIGGTTVGTGADDQVIDTFHIESDILEISLEDDGEAAKQVDLSPYLDNTDDQTIDQFQISSDILSISLEDDGEAPQTVDLSPYLDDTDTDDQTLSWNGTNGELTIVDGNTVDLDGRYIQDDETTVTDLANGLDITETGDDITIEYDILELAAVTPTLLDIMVIEDQSDSFNPKEVSLSSLQSLIDTDTNTQLSDEEVQDIIGNMVTGNTETNITVTYDDGDGTLDFVVSGVADGNGIFSSSNDGGSVTAAAGDYNVTLNDNFDWNGGQLYLEDASGEVGIGTTSPIANLHIEGLDADIQVTATNGSSSPSLILSNSADNASWLMQNNFTANEFRIGYDNAYPYASTVVYPFISNTIGEVTLTNYAFDSDQTVGAGQDNYVLTYDNGSGKISLEAATGGSDDQTIDQFQISSDILSISLEDDGEAPQTVDLSPYLDDTDTDDQTLSWNGTNGELTIVDGNTVDLDGRYIQDDETTVTDLANGLDITETGDDITIAIDAFELSTVTPSSLDYFMLMDQSDSNNEKKATIGNLQSLLDTDDQTIDQFQISSDILSISLEDDGEAPQTVDLSPYLDDTNDGNGIFSSSNDGGTVTAASGDCNITMANNIDFESLLYIDDADDRIGVGTSDPQVEFHIDDGTSVNALSIGETVESTSAGSGVTIYTSVSDAIIYAHKLETESDDIHWKYGTGTSAGHSAPIMNFDNSEDLLFTQVDFEVRGNDLIVENGVGTTQFIVDNPSGNVGIGNITPSQELDVDGDVRIRGDIYDSNNSSGSPGQILGQDAGGIVWQSSSSDGNGIFSTSNDGATVNSASGDFDVNLADNFDFDSGLLYIDNGDQNVGIGTTSPNSQSSLNISDSGGTGSRRSLWVTRSVSSSTSNNQRASYTEVNTSHSSGTVSAITAHSTSTLNSSSGNVTDTRGIQSSVGLSGSGDITHAYGFYSTVYDISSGTITNGYGVYIDDIQATNAYGLYQENSGDDNYFAGDLGIGDTSPDAELDVVGDIHYTGNITDVSDVRLKENLQQITTPIDKVLQLRGLTFNMKGQERERREAGVIAQDVQKVLPEAVSIIDEDGHLGVDYTQLVPLLIEAIKEQQSQIQSLEKRITALEKANQ